MDCSSLDICGLAEAADMNLFLAEQAENSTMCSVPSVMKKEDSGKIQTNEL